MSSGFSNNPFAVLQGKVEGKPKKSKTNSVKKSAQKISKTPKQFVNAVENDDEMLFLQAVQSVVPSKTQVVHEQSFVEHEDFEKLNAKFQKKNKKLENDYKSKSVIENHTKKTLLSNTNTVATEFENTLIDADDPFMKAMLEVKPLQGKGRDVAPVVEPSNAVSVVEQSYAELMESRVEFALALKGEYLEGHVKGLDEMIMNALRSGQYSPEAHFDLHGLNSLQAYNALVGFFRGSWYKGIRTVLIIPGRGKNSLNGFSVLRDKLQMWLTQEPFKRVVLAFCTARPVDGGPGSIYVLLRKYKKKGKINWERIPSDPDLF